MRVCDKHKDRQAIDMIVLEKDDTRVDVCDECRYQVLELLATQITEVPKKRGRPPKDLAQAN